MRMGNYEVNNNSEKGGTEFIYKPTIKVIDLLNKIANGEEYKNCNLIWHSKTTGKNIEKNVDAETFIYESLFYKYLTLNDEVEIIEEDKKIEKLPYYSLEKIQKAKNKEEHIEQRIRLVEQRINDYHEKINEIIDKLNKDKE